MSKYYLLFIVAGLFTACSPEDLAVSDGIPKFKAELKIDGVPTTFEAGNDEFYLKPSFENERDVLVFQSSFLKDETCTNICSEKLKIEIGDYQLFDESNFDVEGSIQIGTYEFLSPQEISLANSFLELINTSIADGPIITSWDVENFDFEAIFQNIISIEIPNLISLPALGLSIQGPGCQSSMNKSYSNSNAMNYCDASIQIINEGGILAAKVVGSGIAPFKIQWNDVNPVDTVSGLLILHDGFDGILSATVEDATGCIIDVRLDMHGDFAQSCQADFSYNIIDPLSPVAGLSKINVEYTDQAGITYRSKLVLQDPSSFFRIDDVKDYILDEEGNPTKELAIAFDVNLKSDDGKIIRITEGESNLAVSYPAN